MHRPGITGGCVALALGLLALPFARASGPGTPNAIQRENLQPGATDWQLTRVKLDKGMSSFRTLPDRGLLQPAIRGCRRDTQDNGQHGAGGTLSD